MKLSMSPDVGLMGKVVLAGEFAVEAMMAQCAQDRLRIFGPDSRQTVTAFEEIRQFGVPESSLNLLKSKRPI